MSREEFIELWEDSITQFADIVDIAHHMDLKSFYPVYARDEICDYMDDQLDELVRGIVWEDLRELLNDAHTDIYEDQCDYYDTERAFGCMGMDEDDYDRFFLYFREEMDANDLWEDDEFQEFISNTYGWALAQPIHETQTCTPIVAHDVDKEIDNVEEFIFV